jgi:outer membrane receptor for ferrienterochelin and colicins
MRLAFIIAFIAVPSIQISAQNTFKALVRDLESSEPLPGATATATINGTTLGSSANANGLLEIQNVPDGNHAIEFSFMGYHSQMITVHFPQPSSEPMNVLLEADDEELEEIVITSTRSSRTIADIPTRVEFIAGEELDEKANMKPGDIRMLLNESTGIQTQQTSPTSANASIRIQGLDGRYTQLLKDGFPIYAGFSGGLGLLQTLPLDLKQVEVIKGSSSTLYGGGAIAGMVNLISRVPKEKRDLKFFINGTSAKGLDLSGFYGKKFNKVGLTVFASRNTSEPYDPADIDLTAIPKFQRYSFNPKLFVDFNEKTSVTAGVNFTTEDRIGGDIKYINGDGDATHSYFERNDSQRYSTQLSFARKLNKSSSINVKNSINHFDRVVETPAYRFDGAQNSTFTELNFATADQRSEWITGLNLWTDDFSEKQPPVLLHVSE